MQQKVPFSLIRCSSSKVAFCSCVEWGWHIYNIVESESDPLTRRAVDLFEKEPLKGNSEVHLHTPTKFGEDRSKDLGGDREQTDRQTNRQTDKRCSIYSMIWVSSQLLWKWIHQARIVPKSNFIDISCMSFLMERICFQSIPWCHMPTGKKSQSLFVCVLCVVDQLLIYMEQMISCILPLDYNISNYWGQ